jgi:TonB family protein
MTDSSIFSASGTPDPTSVLLQPKPQLPRLDGNRNSTQILAELRATIAVGGVNLDAMLQRIVDAAQMFTDANGAAIALQHDNWVVCRARSGDMAPELNSKLDTGSGISGECLRSGKALWCLDTSADSRVDAAACRRLGLRSLAAAPIGPRPNVQGILEAFSARPYAFGDTEVSLLTELAELATAAQQGSTPVALLTHEKRASKSLSFSKRKLIAGALATLAFVVWLGLRKRPEHSSLAATAAAHPLNSESSPAAVDFSGLQLKPSPVTHGNTKTRPPAGGVMTSKNAKSGGGEGVMERPSTETASNADTPLLNVPAPRSRPPQSPDESAPVAPPAPEVSSSSDKAIAGLLSSSAVFPQPVMVSQGLSGGTLEYKVSPIYPTEARRLRREGRVTLVGVITEDGRLRELKVAEGDAMLVRAAMSAVSQWRYHPYKLNGVPVRMGTKITLIFKLP